MREEKKHKFSKAACPLDFMLPLNPKVFSKWNIYSKSCAHHRYPLWHDKVRRFVLLSSSASLFHARLLTRSLGRLQLSRCLEWIFFLSKQQFVCSLRSVWPSSQNLLDDSGGYRHFAKRTWKTDKAQNVLHISSQTVQNAQAAGALNSIKVLSLLFLFTNGHRAFPSLSLSRSCFVCWLVILVWFGLVCHCAKNAKKEDAFDGNEFSMLCPKRFGSGHGVKC